jgi:hypothetical protein
MGLTLQFSSPGLAVLFWVYSTLTQLAGEQGTCVGLYTERGGTFLHYYLGSFLGDSFLFFLWPENGLLCFLFWFLHPKGFSPWILGSCIGLVVQCNCSTSAGLEEKEERERRTWTTTILSPLLSPLFHYSTNPF